MYQNLRRCSSFGAKFFNRPQTLTVFRPSLRYQSCGSKDSLKDALAKKIATERERVAKFRKEHGKQKIGEITVNTVYGGMRGMIGLICETSNVDPEEGIRYRGRTIPDLQKELPKFCGNDGEPMPEGVFWLLCTGEIPTKEQAQSLSKEWVDRAELPDHVTEMLLNFPKTLHPMTQLSCAVTALNCESNFVEAFNEGVKKTEYWEYVYEDAMELIAKLNVICAVIYLNTFCDGLKSDLCICRDLDWTGNFTKMCGYEDEKFAELLRLYLTIHSDHEGGNVSAHAVSLVGSALSDPFLSYAAGMNGLAGPLHGLANQEVLIWLTQMQKEVGDKPDEGKIKAYVEKTLKEGKVVPGYGHAVLRKTDPRFTAQAEFAKKHLPDDPTCQLVATVYKVVPPILQATGKVQNPWPNVDAHSGALLTAFGMTQMSYYTVIFAMSRALGVMAQLIWNRALMLPIERPKSISTDTLARMAFKDRSTICKEETPEEKKKTSTSTESCQQKKQSADDKKPSAAAGKKSSSSGGGEAKSVKGSACKTKTGKRPASIDRENMWSDGNKKADAEKTKTENDEDKKK